MTDPPVPPQAITAAAEVLTNVILDGRPATTGDALRDAAVATLMLEAALPHLAAAVPTGVIHVEGGKLSKAELEELAKWRAAYSKGDYTVLPDDTEERIAAAVAAEREACAQLAESVGARYQRGPGDPRPFAALLQEARP